jgi:hypothetical protein
MEIISGTIYKEQSINTKPNLLELFEKAKAQFTNKEESNEEADKIEKSQRITYLRNL